MDTPKEPANQQAFTPYSTLHPRAFYHAIMCRHSTSVKDYMGRSVDIEVVEITTIGGNERTTFSLFMSDARILARQLNHIIEQESANP